MSIRVLVVDDSAFMRRVIGDAISSEADMQLVGLAHNGLDALLKVEQLQPDVVTLDVEMPEMDGLTALRHLMARYPRPVVMLSSQTHEGAATTLRALAMGAVEFVPKPSGSVSLDFGRVRDDLLHKIRIAATARVRRSSQPSPPNPPLPGQGEGGNKTNRGPEKGGRDIQHLVVIGASTGGPRALGVLIPSLPRDGRTAYLVVQHMPAGFTRSLADRLDSSSALDVMEAAEGARLEADRVLVAPGDRHMVVHSRGLVELDDGPRLHGVRPSVDVTLESVAAHYGHVAVVVMLTGMGSDGATGAVAVHTAGGYVVAEDESSCVVWGMPRAVIEQGVADRVVPLDGMAEAIVAAVASRGIGTLTRG